MDCPACGQGNRDGAAFCRNCGRLLLPDCPRCHASVHQPANFCDTCGYPLGPAAWTRLEQPPVAGVRRAVLPQAGPGEPAVATAAQGDGPQLERYIPRELLSKLKAARRAGEMAGERRIVTMLFCDVKGSTAVAGQLDPEEWSEIINGAFERMVRPVYRYEGIVARLMGDGLLAFFGAPIAHEDDPRRAVLAGLEIVAGVRDYAATLADPGSLAIRVGINTGLVVVGAVGSDLRLEYSALGDAINLAARMEQTAVPGTIQITDDTHRLVAGQFDVEPLGGVEVKGKAQPILAYRVLGRRSVTQTRRQLARRSPLVNRVAEWDVLHDAFAGLANGRGGIIFLTGEAGLGKTRLMDEALARLLPDNAKACEATAFSYESGQPFGLINRLVRQALDLAPGLPASEVRSRVDIEAGEGNDWAVVLHMLLGVASGAEDADISGEQFAHQLVTCMESFWRERATATPIVLALDDLQWADASSVDLLTRLFALTESRAVLFLCAMRHDRRAQGWRLKEAAAGDFPHRFREMALYPLSDSDSRMLLDAVLGEADLPGKLAARILEKAEGNPLFVEEVAQNLIERGHLVRESEGMKWTIAAPVETIELPGSLQALLTARIDRLDESARETLQVASIIGRRFRRSSLAALADDLDRLDAHLLYLQRMELIREVTRLPEPEYVFNHTLTHEATVNTILLRQRRALHLRLAETLERQLSEGADIPGSDMEGAAAILAHHFLEADEPSRALPHLITGADNALRLSAAIEAIGHYERALAIALRRSGDDNLITDLYLKRGRALELQSDFVAADHSYEEMEQLAGQRGGRQMELGALIARGKLRSNVTPFYDPVAGRELMTRALTLAQKLGDQTAEVRILWNLVNIDRFDLGSLERARENGERGLAMARELGLEEETAYLLNDLGDIYGTLGNLAAAKGVLDEAQERWRAIGNKPMLVDSLCNSAIWDMMAGKLDLALAEADEAYELAARIDNLWSQAYSGMCKGPVLSWLGRVGAGIEALRQGISKAGDAGFVGGQLLGRSFLSSILLDLGQADEAIGLAKEGYELGRDRLPQFAVMCAARLAVSLLEQDRLAEASDTMADPLFDLEQVQVFVIYDLSLARIGYALAVGRAEDALVAADLALAEVRRQQATTWLPDLLGARSRACEALGRWEEALADRAEAVALARRIGMRGTLWRHLALYGVLLERAEQRDAERSAFEEAAGVLEFVLDNLWPAELKESLRNQPLARLVSEKTGH